MPPQPDVRSALVILHMQRALFDSPESPPESAFIVRRVCALVERARREDVQIVFVQHSCEAHPKGSHGWRLIDPLAPRFPDWVIQTSGPDLFHSTNLAAQLKAVGISRLVLAGAGTGMDAACRASAEFGFELVLAADAHISFDSCAPSGVITACPHQGFGGPAPTRVAAEAVAL